MDYAKAFDSLDKTYILKVFETLNFGDNFIKWLKVYSSQTLSSVLYNGWLTIYVKVERGIRQGCPLSALLFVIAIEPLACKLRGHADIKGIKIQSEHQSNNIVLTQYADDNTLFLDGRDSFNNAMIEIDHFANVYVLKLNYGKTEGMWIGGARGRT